MRRALALDPFSLDTNWLLGWACISSGRLDEAEQLASGMLAMDSSVWLGHHIRGAVKWAKGLWAEAVPDIEAVATIEGGPMSAAVLCWCYARAGRSAEARQTLERLEQMSATRIVPPTLAGPGLRRRGGRRAGTAVYGPGHRRTPHAVRPSPGVG
ncbi:MAG: hypothetical protein MZW92_42425 [Comamonadaceae bacterium]|nr:hypothetical protein [Comamonadaceae bacterium]